MRVLGLTLLLNAFDFFRNPFGRTVVFANDDYPLRPAEKYGESDVVVILGFIKDHQPVAQLLKDYSEDIAKEKDNFSDESTYFLLCDKFEKFLSVEAQCAYQIKINKDNNRPFLEKTKVNLKGDWFIRS